MSLRIKIGADPELFLTDASGRFVSAHDVLPGTKLSPYPVQRGAIQVDGVAAEFNIDPAEDSDHFTYNIKHVMEQMKKEANGLSFSIKPFAVFDKDYFDSLPEVVKELGCNPDFNAWTGQVNPAPNGAASTMRTASGHLHIGWCENVNPHGKIHFEDCCSLVKELDYYIGLYSLMWDPDNTRRQMYGKAGAFRPKPYGCEYRVLSNAWLKSPRLQVWIFNTIQQAVFNLINKPKSMVKQFDDYARKVIDGNDVNWWKSSEGKAVHFAICVDYPDLRDFKELTDKDKIKEEEILRLMKK